MTYTLLWHDPTGLGRWRACADAAAIRETAARLAATGDAEGGEVRILASGPRPWAATSSALALASWDGAAPPVPLVAARSHVDLASDGAARLFAMRVAQAAIPAVAAGLIDARQAEALERIAELAVAGEGPAGRGVDPETIRPAAIQDGGTEQ